MRHRAVLKLARIFLAACVTFVILFAASLANAQAPTVADNPEDQLKKELDKYPGLMDEVGRLVTKIQLEVQMPPDRPQSALLPLLPASTAIYASLPNYGEASHQILKVFQQQLPQSPAVRAWWQHGDMASDGPKIEDSLEKFYQLSQYLGDEIAVAGAMDGDKDPNFVIIAEVHKPGLVELLRQMVKETAKSKTTVRVLEPGELATARDTRKSDEIVVLVRPDFFVAGFNLASVRKVNSHFDEKSHEFATSEFGMRVAQEYEGGAAFVAAADLQKILKQIPQSSAQNEEIFRSTGFADAKYFTMKQSGTLSAGTSQMELSFTGPRHGVAAWLAAPAHLGSLDFVSPKAVFAVTMLLKSPAQIFDEIKSLATVTNPNAFAGIAQMEQGLNLSLKDDLLSRLGGEITIESESLTETQPQWEMILGVSDPERVQATLNKLLVTAPVQPRDSVEDGVVYHGFQIPTQQAMLEVGYAIVDGYLIIASGHDKVQEAVRLHRSGTSLARSDKFLAALPPGHSAEVSAVFYEDPVAMIALSMKRMFPGMMETLMGGAQGTPPIAVCAYGDETSLREISKSGGFNPGMILVGAAIAIPNLLRARIAANESSAVGMMRTANTAQVVYAAAYPARNFARDFASLGPNPKAPATPSPLHADLIDDALGNSNCTAGAWCKKSGYLFSMKATCKTLRCSEYVVVAIPESANTGTKSFCTTSEAVIRSKIVEPMAQPITAKECLSWPPLQP